MFKEQMVYQVCSLLLKKSSEKFCLSVFVSLFLCLSKCDFFPLLK